MKYKTKIITMLSNDEDIITALDVKENEKLLYNYLYPYFYIDDIQEIVKNYICVTLDHKINENEYFKDAVLIFHIICHKSEENMKTKFDGNRCDLLEGLIINKFNWNTNIGLELKAQRSIEGNLTNKYYHRTVEFKTLRFNSLECGVKING